MEGGEAYVGESKDLKPVDILLKMIVPLFGLCEPYSLPEHDETPVNCEIHSASLYCEKGDVHYQG